MGKTSRWEIKGSAPVWEFLQEGQNTIFAFWHNRFVVMPYVYGYYFSKNRIAVITSRSRDGELVGGVLQRFGFLTVRGSTSRGGREALLSLARRLKEDWDAAVTPDGPRGPRYQVQDGIISLAAISGAPIVPLSYAGSRRIIIRKSWDHMRIPLPGGRLKVAFAPPLWVERGVSKRQRPVLARELRTRLLQADREAEAG